MWTTLCLVQPVFGPLKNQKAVVTRARSVAATRNFVLTSASKQGHGKASSRKRRPVSCRHPESGSIAKILELHSHREILRPHGGNDGLQIIPALARDTNGL